MPFHKRAILFPFLLCAIFFLKVPGEMLTKNDEAASVWGTDRCKTVSCRFKAPNPETPSKLVNEWHQQDTDLWSFVSENVPDVLEHTGAAAFDEHLRGVQAVLRYWDAPPHLTKAGLFHSIYGTEGFQGFALPLTQREAIQDLIGSQAEKLVFVFCMLDRSTLDQTIFDYDTKNNNTNRLFQLRARPELGRFNMTLTKDEWLDFVELTLADWMEQVEGAAETPSEIFLWKHPGEAYAYRRLAFRRMSRILAVERVPRLQTVVPQMLQDVMATEGESTLHLVQLRTPPMSQAAKDALLALRAAGDNEGIPDDFLPRPIESNGNVVKIEPTCQKQ